MLMLLIFCKELSGTKICKNSSKRKSKKCSKHFIISKFFALKRDNFVIKNRQPSYFLCFLCLSYLLLIDNLSEE